MLQWLVSHKDIHCKRQVRSPYYSNLNKVRVNQMQVLNVLLRFAWLQTVLDFQFSFLHTQGLITIVASLEIIRRGIWNFFRYNFESSVL